VRPLDGDGEAVSADVAVPVVKFVLVQVCSLEPAAPLLIVSEGTFTKAHERRIAEQDLAITMAAELLGGLEAQITPSGDTVAVLSPRIGGYVALDLSRAEDGRLAAAVVCRPEETELVEGAPRFVGRSLRVDAASRVAAKKAREPRA
jgi:hypothetical protein